ncbi:MAG: hypothetical protein ACI3ZK_03725 [Candidatus Cryptobacteroides sp.]
MENIKQKTILETKAHPAIKAHIDMLQSIISRMAKNSATCKSWAIPLVTAILTLSLQKEILPTCTAYIPLALFYLLDCYYLGLERKFKDRLRNFIININKGKDISKELFLSHSTDDKCWIVRRLCSIGNQLLCVLDGIFSFSTTIVYGILALCIYLIG